MTPTRTDWKQYFDWLRMTEPATRRITSREVALRIIAEMEQTAREVEAQADTLKGLADAAQTAQIGLDECGEWHKPPTETEMDGRGIIYGCIFGAIIWAAVIGMIWAVTR